MPALSSIFPELTARPAAICYLNGRFHRVMADGSILLLPEGTSLTVDGYHLTLDHLLGSIVITDAACNVHASWQLRHTEKITYTNGIWSQPMSMLKRPPRAA